MGVCISYKGRIADPSRIDELIRQTQAFAEHMGWKTWTVPEMFDEGHIKRVEGLRGITVQISPQCEALHLHFDSEGRFVNHFYYVCVHDFEERKKFFDAIRASPNFVQGDGGDKDGKVDADDPLNYEFHPNFIEDALYYNRIKTQHGGVEVHVQACAQLRFVRDNFAPDIEISDDTGYFDTGNLDEVKSQMAIVSGIIQNIAQATERMNADGGFSSIEDLVQKLGRYMAEVRGPAN